MLRLTKRTYKSNMSENTQRRKLKAECMKIQINLQKWAHRIKHYALLSRVHALSHIEIAIN